MGAWRNGPGITPDQAAEPADEGLVATGDVIIITRTQKITGDKALIDVKANTLTVEGNVVVVQGSSVVKGTKLLVDLTNNRSQMTGGRVKGLFTPSQSNQKSQ